MKQQIHAYFTGRVQGVGFRFTAIEIAQGLGILGWVMNLRDGRVEIVAETEEKILIEFLNKINQNFKDLIQDTDIQWQPATGEFKEFEVKYS